MKAQDKKEMMQIFNEGISQLILPILDSLLKNQEEIKGTLQEHSQILQEHTEILQEHSEILNDHTLRLDSIHRDVRSQREYTDGLDIRVERLEKSRK